MKTARKIVAGALLLAAFGCKHDTPSVPELTGTVIVSGEAKVGQTLRAVASLGGKGEVLYQWARGAADIPGATDETYTLTEADAGSTIKVRAWRAGYEGSVSSAPAAVAFTDVETLKAYLAEQSGGDSVDEPIPLALSVDLSATGAVTSLFAALADKDKYVSLDLSGCRGLTTWARYTDAGAAKIVSLALPDPVTQTPGGSNNSVIFGSFAALKTLEASGLQTVGICTFQDCAALETVSLPAATTIKTRAFQGCTALKTVNLPAAVTIEGYALRDCTALKTVSLPAAATISSYAFYSCTALETVSLPAAATVGDVAFYNSAALKTVNLPAATAIGAHTFKNCTALNTANLPKATAIGRQAFEGCTALKTINLPAAITIGISAFHDCTALASLTLGRALPALGTLVFLDAGKDGAGFTIFVPTALAKTALEAAIDYDGSEWNAALKTSAGIGSGTFRGVAVKG